MTPTITINRATVEQALEALETCDAAHPSDGGQQWYDEKLVEPAITALRAALAQQQTKRACCTYPDCRCPIDKSTVCAKGLPEQAEPVEPVAWIYQNMYTEQEYLVWKKGTGGRNWRPLYTAPPQRKPLTDQEIDRIRADCVLTPHEYRDRAYGWALHFARAVERAHGITDPQVADRLARHGIPMPGDPK